MITKELHLAHLRTSPWNVCLARFQTIKMGGTSFDSTKAQQALHKMRRGMRMMGSMSPGRKSLPLGLDHSDLG